MAPSSYQLTYHNRRTKHEFFNSKNRTKKYKASFGLINKLSKKLPEFPLRDVKLAVDIMLDQIT